MKLNSFLQQHGLTQAGFAAEIGVSQGTVARYCNGTRRPDWPVLEKIKTATQGMVLPQDFMADGVGAPSTEAVEA